MSWESASSPSFMIAPFPNCFSIWLTARSIARSRFTSMPMVTPSPARVATPRPRRPIFRDGGTLLRPTASLQHGSYIFSATSGPQRMAGDGDVDRAARLEPALVEDHLGRGPGPEDGRARVRDRLRQRGPAARRADAPEREVELVRPDPAYVGAGGGASQHRLRAEDGGPHVDRDLDRDEAPHRRSTSGRGERARLSHPRGCGSPCPLRIASTTPFHERHDL